MNGETQNAGNALKFHWTNPRFDGLPWLADKKRKAPAHNPQCVKKAYSQQEAQREAATLRKSKTGRNWFYKFCQECKAFHLSRKVWR
jgi:hypothetical protein